VLEQSSGGESGKTGFSLPGDILMPHLHMVREISTVQSHGGRKDCWKPQVLKTFICV
jgi:hypothetical protein